MTQAPTAEQSEIIRLAKDTPDNLIINALAGCGKTSTLEMLEGACDLAPILYLVFNKKNATEAEGRMLSTTTVRTFNSLGHRIWAAACTKKLSLDPKKQHSIFKAIADETKGAARNEVWRSYQEVATGVNLARALGYVPEGKYPQAKRLLTQSEFHASLDEVPDDLTSDLIDAVLTRSIRQAYDGVIDYNDQIYMPALFGGTFPNFPLTLVDEAQDLSPVNHAMIAKLAKRRIIAVGDPWQSIYGFRGATQGGMAQLKAQYNMTPAGLSTSFRCPQAIVENARWRVPHFAWLKPDGKVEVLDKLSLASIPEGAAIICRNNAPLFRQAMHLLQIGRSVSLAGTEIGPRIIAQMRKLGDESMDQASLLSAIDDWLAERLVKESKTAADMADCMRVFAAFGANLGQAIGIAEQLLAQKGTIQLMTGHKAKGLEFDHVIHLDPWLIGEEEQELNLRYVINTRSKDYYCEVNSTGLVAA